MKKITAVFFLFLYIQNATAQDFPGFRAGNYTGVNGVFFNPASITDSRYRFDVNLFSISTLVGNNKASYKFKTISRTFEADSLESQVFGKNAGPSTGLVSVNGVGPSVLFNVGKKSAVSLTTRFRTIANIIDIDGKLADKLINDLNSNITYPYTISSNQNMQMAVNAWTEFGASYATVLSEKGPHFLKGGISLKYLAGAANGHVSINNLNASLTEDATGQEYLYNTTGRITTGFGGVRISNLDANNFTKRRSSGIGADIGFVYEYRPDLSEHDDTKARNSNKYKWKAGLALLDIGSIKYNKDQSRSGSYDIHITGSQRFYLHDLDTVDIDNYNRFFTSRPQYFTPAGSNTESTYNVALPATVQLDVDYHIKKGFYAQAAAQLPISNHTIYNSRYYSSFTLTPRYEGKVFGAYLPINYNSLTHFNAGLSLRAGPLFIGSGSVLTALVGNARQADLYIGLHFAGLQKKAKHKTKEKENEEISSTH